MLNEYSVVFFPIEKTLELQGYSKTENVMLESQLKSEVIQKVKDFWKKNQSPLLVSQLGGIYNKEQVRQATNGLSFVKWIQENQAELKLKIVVHPVQKEKIGLIPSNENFSYSSDEDSNHMSSNDKELTLAFLELLKKRCNQQELDQIQIPTKILVRLLS